MTKLNPFNSLGKELKLFVRLVLRGIDEKEACLIAYPCCGAEPGTLGFRNLDLRLATIKRNEKVKAAIRYMTEDVANPDIIKNNLAMIMADTTLKPAERLKAIGMLERLSRIEPMPEEPKKRQKIKPGEMHDEQLKAKLRDLETKVLQ